MFGRTRWRRRGESRRGARGGSSTGGGCRYSACGEGGGGGVLPFGLCCRGCWVGGVVWFGCTARPPPPVILPGAAFAALCLAGAFAPGFALRARAAAGGWGAGVGWAGWYGLIEPPRPPPPVILPGAAFAALCLAGAFGAGLRPAGSRCRLPVGKVGGPVSVWRGAEKSAIWGGVDVRVTICKTATSPDWRELRGAPCVASGPKPLRPPLQGAPFDGTP